MSKKRKSGKADRDNFIRGSALTGVLVALVAAIIGAVLWFFAYTKDDGLIYPNVYAFGVDLSGKTVEEAAAAIQDATASTFSTQSMTVQLPDCTLSLTPEQTGAAVDAQAIAQLAFAYGRGGNRWENTQAKAAAALDTFLVDTRGCITLNEDAIRADLERNWAVVAEAIQTILRRENYPNPYETLKALTRTGAGINHDVIADFIETLEVSEQVKEELRAISPWTYTGF